MSNELNTATVAAPAAPLTLAEKLLALAKLQAEQRAKAAAGGAIVAVSKASALRDAFGSPHGTGTHAMHAVFAEAYAAGCTLSRKQIAEEITAMGAMRPVDQHMSTMKAKGRIVSVSLGQWRLSDAAGQLWHGDGKMFGFASGAQTGADDDKARGADRGEQTAPEAPLVAEVVADAPPAVSEPIRPPEASESRKNRKGK